MTKKVGSHFTIKAIFTLQNVAFLKFYNFCCSERYKFKGFTTNCFEKYSEAQVPNYTQFPKEVGMQHR